MRKWTEDEIVKLEAGNWGTLSRTDRACVDKLWRLNRSNKLSDSLWDDTKEWQDFQDSQVEEYNCTCTAEDECTCENTLYEAASPTPFDEAAAQLNGILGYDPLYYPPNKWVEWPTSIPEDKGYKIAIMPCLHIPLHSEHNFAQLVSMSEMGDVDELVIAGDMLDCLSAAHAGFKRNIRPGQYKSLVEEMATGKVILQLLASLYPMVTIMRGNHVDRVRKYFAERVPEFMFLVNYDVLGLLAADFPNVKVVDYVDLYGNDIGWIYQVGDVRICHAEVGSKVALKPVTDLDRWMTEWSSYIESSTIFGPYRMLVECHTHQAGILFQNSGSKILVEGGCLCKPQQYSLEPSIPYPHPQTNAVTLATLYDGKVDVNSVRQLVFDTVG